MERVVPILRKDLRRARAAESGLSMLHAAVHGQAILVKLIDNYRAAADM